MGKCVFCRIAEGREAASVVCREDGCTAILDVRPVNPGHVLVVPDRHAASLADLPPDAGARMFRLGQRVAAALRQGDSPCDGVNLFLADGRAAGQEVGHVHLHVIPRFSGDGFGLRFGPSYGVCPPREELDRRAAAIRRHLAP